MYQLRNSAKAIIIEEGQLLTIKSIDAEGRWYSLPGGGQKAGETLIQAVKRECLEELGIEIEVGPLRYIREYIGVHHEFAEFDFDAHQIEHMFLCTITKKLSSMAGTNPDHGQIGTTWLPVRRLTTYRLYPKYLRPLLANEPDYSGPVYLGDVN
jgi:8-oxo-dGTP pyrophosphatase MutT (NUDIX family)